MMNAIQIALSGLAAAGKRVQAGADNIANLNTEGALDPADGPAPYAEQTVAQATDPAGGVQATIIPASKPFVPAYNPDSPFANADGLVGAPATDLATEIVNLKLAGTAYKANLKTIQAASDMQKDLLDIIGHKA